MPRNKIICKDDEWTIKHLEQTWVAIEKIVKKKYPSLSYFAPQFEVINYNKMLNIQSSVGLPHMYSHWSYGKSFVKDEENYMSGKGGTIYEIVLNTDPSICYLMDSNSYSVQALVMCHAAVGHSAFFKNNTYFKEHTRPKTMVSFLQSSKKYIESCEHKYGAEAVERVLDAGHALANYGFTRHTPKQVTASERRTLNKSKRREKEKEVNYLHTQIKLGTENRRHDWFTTTPHSTPDDVYENILQYIADNSLGGKTWQSKILNILCHINQYLYPQGLTKVMNEGYASFWHHKLMHDLFDAGYILEDHMLEFFKLHTGVVHQQKFGALNPYKLGLEIWNDIERICTNPTEEDLEWFPDIANTDWQETMQYIMENYKDETFIKTFLSPKVIRDLQLLAYEDDAELDYTLILETADREGYEKIQKLLGNNYNYTTRIPNIFVAGHYKGGQRNLILVYIQGENQDLDVDTRDSVLTHIQTLWGGPVRLDVYEEVDHGEGLYRLEKVE